MGAGSQLTSPAMTLQLLAGVRIATPFEMELTDQLEVVPRLLNFRTLFKPLLNLKGPY